MTPATLTPLLYVVTVFAWLSAILLVWIARTPPHSPTLSERARVSVIVAVFLTAYSVFAANVDGELGLVDVNTARVLLRAMAIGLGLIPTGWLWLWWKR